MEKHIQLLGLSLLIAFNSTAQLNNPIFTGGSADGWATGDFAQPDNNIFTGGASDGWASESFQQPENNIFKGGSDDGWASEVSNIVVIDLGTSV